MPQPAGLAAFFGGGGSGDADLRDAAREQQIAASGLPHVILKAGPIRDVPGGSSALSLSAGGPPGSSGSGSSRGGGDEGISREDLAVVVARLALDVQVPEGREASTLVVESAGPGEPPEDWQAVLQPLLSSQ